MGKVTLAGAMPGDQLNGLGPYSKEFLENPREARLVVCLVSSGKTVKNHDNGEEHPVLRVRHWELVASDPKSQKAAAELLGQSLSARTGILELPLGAGSDVPMKDAFPEGGADMEPGLGEGDD